MYEWVFGMDWWMILDEEVICWMYVFGVFSVFGYLNCGEFECICWQVGIVYGWSVFQFVFEEGK